MAQDYDKIFKENIERIILPLAKRLGIEPQKMEELPANDLQRTLERRPDFLKKIVEPSPDKSYILHIEFQTEDEYDMVYRMLEYCAMLMRKYKMEVKQHVFFLGAEPPRMPTSISIGRLSFQFSLISIHNFSYRSFLESETPEEVILAVLADFEEDSPEKVIFSILHRINDLPTETIQKQKCVVQLEILAKLRKLQPEILKQLATMPIVYDLKEDLRYQQGVEEATKRLMEEFAAKEAELQRAKEAELQRAKEAELQRAKEAELQRAKEAELLKSKAEEMERIISTFKMWHRGVSVEEIAAKLDVSEDWIRKIIE